MITIAICDDEPEAAKRLEEEITKYTDQRGLPCKIYSFPGAVSLLASRIFCDITFLDIRMPGMTGMEAARRLRELHASGFLVFVTAVEECVYDAFEVEASAYLVKPVEGPQLCRVLDRIISKMEKESPKALWIHTAKWSRTIKFDDILFCEVINRKVYVHTKKGVVDYYGKMSELEKQLDENFFKCHRSYIVNLEHVAGWETESVRLENERLLPLSRLRREAFSQAVFEYMKNRI